MTSVFYIYLVESPSGKVYIGKTNNFRVRKNSHLRSAKNPRTPMARAVSKYGSQLVWKVLETVKTNEEALLREQLWVRRYNSNCPKHGYNLTAGGEGLTGYRLTEETKEKIRQKAIGRRMSVEVRERRAKSLRGTRNHKLLAGAARAAKSRRRAVRATNISTGAVQDFESKAAAAEFLGVWRQNINHVLRGKVAHAGGWKFEALP